MTSWWPMPRNGGHIVQVSKRFAISLVLAVAVQTFSIIAISLNNMSAHRMIQRQSALIVQMLALPACFHVMSPPEPRK